MDFSFALHLLVTALERGVEKRKKEQYLGIERLFASLVGGQQQDLLDDVRGPAVLVPREGDTPIAIEVKVLNARDLEKSLRNQVADLLTAATRTHHSFRGEVTQSVAILIAGAANADAFGDISKLGSIMAEKLLRSDEGIGYDSLLFGSAETELPWYYFSVKSDKDADFPLLLSATDAINRLRGQESTLGPLPTKETGGRSRRILLIADEWRSGHGGLSTLNRELATALASRGVDAAVMVPQSSDEDVKAASEVNVAVVTPARVPGLTDRETLLLRPVFAEPDWEPDVIVGHGRLLGPYAAAQQQQFFPRARRVHFVHTAAEQLEAAKEELGGSSNMRSANERRSLERSLALSADLIVGVGPLLTETIRDELIGPNSESTVICLIPGLRTAFDVSRMSAPVKNHVLFVGRADDFTSKGIDIAAEALLKIVDRWPTSRPHPPVLVVRGVPDDAATAVKNQLDAIFDGRVQFHLRPYSDSEDEVMQDISQARMILMPSRHEGFGLAAYEAIACGVPVLISSESGLAQFLQESKIDTVPSSVVTTRNSSTSVPGELWADAVQQVLDNSDHARNQAIELRNAIRNVVTWDRSAAGLLAALDVP